MMRRSLLALSLMAGLAVPAFAASPVVTEAKAASARSLWLVQFAETPLASYRGPEADAASKGMGALAPTSPLATGATRLDAASPAARAYRKALAHRRQTHLAQASARLGRPLEPLLVYEAVSHGAALELTAEEARLLATLDGVRSVQPDFVRAPLTDAGPGWIRADALWNAAGGSGNRGEGQIIGIIDTGIDAAHLSFEAEAAGYRHRNPRPGALGLCAEQATAGCNGKLIGIYDFTVGESDEEANDGSDASGHGTHVAAIAAGNPLSVNFGAAGSSDLSGVAPRAHLISYKACEEKAKCRGAWVLKALDQAVLDRVDVINYSIGGGALDPWVYGDSLAMLRAREAGVVVVVAAGNDGPADASHASPGNAPWVLGVANVSHDRASISQVTLSGGATPPPNGGVLRGASQTEAGYGPAALVHGAKYGSALCASGPNQNALPPDSSTSPWEGKVFDGQIVVCERGTYARVIKGLNVKNAGGGGMLLLNQADDGEQIVADRHEVPASHLGHADAQALRAWLAHGSGHQATISASRFERVAAFGDILAPSSGRGPAPGDWLKPNLAAPGTNILAAYVGPNNEELAFLSGTSMAAPHVAGAVALLRRAQPHWSVAQIESAMQTTARAGVRQVDGRTPAGVFDAGSGTLDLSRAVKAGLYFPLDAAQFQQANPATGGQPRALNLPALVDGRCFAACSFSRTVSDMGGGGTWTVEARIEGGGLKVSPERFTLAEGASRELSFSYQVDAQQVRYNHWLQGEVRLRREGGGRPDVVLPVAIRPHGGNVPEVFEQVQALESGWMDLGLSGLAALPSARFSASDLIEPLQVAPVLAQDPTQEDPFDGLSREDLGTRFFYVDSSRAGAMRFRTEARSGTAGDIDLFVGLADGFDALPSKETQLCASSLPEADEVCELDLEVAAGTRFWVLVQNWQASASGSDQVELASGLIPLTPSQAEPALRRLRVTGPGQVAQGEAFTLRLGWEDPGFAPGQMRWGHVFIGPDAARAGDLGAVRVKLQRPSQPLSAASLLLPGERRELRLAPGQALDRLYIDVPDNAASLEIAAQGEHVSLHLQHVPAPRTPGIEPAPSRTRESEHVLRPGPDQRIRIEGSQLKPGRWYLTPVNTGTVSTSLWLSAQLTYRRAPQLPAFGNWYNPARSGSGFQLAPAVDGSIWSLAWYTYLQDGTPVWYLGTGAAPQGPQGHFVFDLNRFAWDGRQAQAVAVGRGLLSFVAADTMRFSWNLDGESGSQSVRLASNGSCLGLEARQRLDGNWYEPERPGYGYDINTYAGVEAILAYLYDAQGQPRWLQAAGERSPSLGQNAVLPLFQHSGACPLCAWTGPYRPIEVGQLSRRYASTRTGQIGVQARFAPPLAGEWQQQGEARLLSLQQRCRP